MPLTLTLLLLALQLNQPLDPNTLKQGDTVYFISPYRPVPTQATVDHPRPYQRPSTKLILNWTDEEVGWCSLGTPYTIYATHQATSRASATRLRNQALELLRQADELDPPKPTPKQ